MSDEQRLKELHKLFESEAREAYRLKTEYHAKQKRAYELRQDYEKLRKRVEDQLGASFEEAAAVEQPEPPQERIQPITSDRNVLSKFCVVLVRTSGPVNLGQICRCCGNLGITDLRLVNPICEVNCSETRRYANHAKSILFGAKVYDSLRVAVEDCGLVIGTSGKKRHPSQVLCAVESVPKVLVTHPAEKYAIVFGNESEGLSNDELDQCQVCVMLHTRGVYPSYNLSHAVAITLYTLSSQSRQSLHEESRGAEHKDSGPTEYGASRKHIDRLKQFVVETLDRTGYRGLHVGEVKRNTTLGRIHNVFDRVHLSKQTVNLLYGITSHVDRITKNYTPEPRWKKSKPNQQSTNADQSQE